MISQRPPIFLTSPWNWIESDFDSREGTINSKSTTVADAESTVQLWKVVPRAGYGYTGRFPFAHAERLTP